MTVLSDTHQRLFEFKQRLATRELSNPHFETNMEIDEAWQPQRDFHTTCGSNAICSTHRTTQLSVDTGAPTDRRLEQVEAELAIANAELSSLRELLSMAETQLREVVARSVAYVRDVQTAATREIYSTIRNCNALLRKLESSGGARHCDASDETMLPSRWSSDSDMDFSTDENTQSLFICLESAEKEVLQTKLRVKELEKELFDSESERKRIEDHLENSVLTALKLQDVLVMQKIVMKLEKLPATDIRRDGHSLAVASLDIKEESSEKWNGQEPQKKKRQLTQEKQTSQ